jgi:uncharacterized protein (DUF2225 family)
MAVDSPFFLTRVECPICKTINEYEMVRVGAYVENGRDSDFCPRDINWRVPKYQAYNPLVFFIATCDHCLYSREMTGNFKDWKNDNNFRTYRLKTIKEKHLDRLATADSFVKKLGEAIDIARYPNESAILKLHLAVFDEQLNEHHSQLDVGRFYLRVGWVFRGLEEGENPQVLLLRGLMHDSDAKYQVMRHAVRGFHEQADAFSQSIDSHFDSDEISAELKSQIYPYRNKFGAAASSLGEALRQTDERLSDLDRLLDEYKSVTLGSDESGCDAPFGRYRSFAEFLLDVKKSWSGVVADEHEALEKAVHYYKEAFAEGRDIAPGNQQIQASYLIAELSRRIGDYDEARQYFNSTIRHGQEFIYNNRNDATQTALARKILELAVEQGKSNMATLQTA